MRYLTLASLSLLAACSAQTPGTATVKDAANGTRPGWCHDQMTSADAANILFDYQVLTAHTGSAYLNRAVPAWLNVSRAGLSGQEHVRAVMISKAFSVKFESEGPNYFDQVTTQIDLTYDAANAKFTGPLPAGLPLYEYAEGDDDATAYAFEFAVVIDGTWLKDPVSGGSNFSYIPKHQGATADCQAATVFD